MKRTILLLTALLTLTVGKADFVSEPVMKDDLLQMLADFTVYMKNDFQDCVEPNSEGEACGCFRGENTMANDERGVRPNADLSMICAFLVKYGKGKVTLPENVTWDDLESMAMKSLVFAYSTHKANKLKVCAGNNYWGSVSNDDHVWESSLWAMSVAYSAFFQWHKLMGTQKYYIHTLLKAECNYELERSIPTGYAGDTKAEENGWEADVLAAALGLFPNDPEAPRWFQRLREFAINSYSQKDDASNHTVIDPDYDQQTIADLYKGQNLYDDYTLQNHNYFHTSYQNVVIQELGEAALALKLFQTALRGEEKWKTNALMHNNDRVMQDVLFWLALSDGELAMPNGNDWSLFLYDQITSYSTNACFLRDPHALMLENLAYRMIKARQKTTNDGSWLLRADVGARRMGVEAHRVMMTWLMHEVLPTADLTPTTWSDFNRQYSRAKVFPSQDIVRASTPSRFTCFSWSKGLQSYTGYIAPHTIHNPPSTIHHPQSTIHHPLSTLSNLIVPFRANNTGNFLGWYDVEGKKTNAKPVGNAVYYLQGDAYVMNGELTTNEGTLNNSFALYSTPGNAVVYIDCVRANDPVTIKAEKGGLMAISTDEFTSIRRTLFTSEGQQQLEGTTFTTMKGPWVNVDNQLGIHVIGHKQIAFGERANNNSVMTSRLYASFSDSIRNVSKDEVVDRRAIVYYSNTDATTTARLASLNSQLATAAGWNGVIVFDPDMTGYLLLSNLYGDAPCTLPQVTTPFGAPVFTAPTTITPEGASATFTTAKNHSYTCELRFFVEGKQLTALQASDDSSTFYLRNDARRASTATVTAHLNGHSLTQKLKIRKKPLKIVLSEGRLITEEIPLFPTTQP